MNVLVKVKLRSSIVNISKEHVKISNRIKMSISYVENDFPYYLCLQYTAIYKKICLTVT